MNEVWKCDLIIIKFGELWDQECPFGDTHLLGVLYMNAGEQERNELTLLSLLTVISIKFLLVISMLIQPLRS